MPLPTSRAGLWPARHSPTSGLMAPPPSRLALRRTSRVRAHQELASMPSSTVTQGLGALTKAIELAIDGSPLEPILALEVRQVVVLVFGGFRLGQG